MLNFESHKKRLIQGVIVFSFLAAGQTAISQEMMNCDVEEHRKEFHITAPSTREDLRPLPLLGAEGGEGSLSTLIAQQVTSDGKNVLEFDAGGVVEVDGIEVQLIAADFEGGAISFEACTESSFLVLAVYRAGDGSLAGVPSNVLGSKHNVNYANITDTSDQRVGVRFNDGGASDTLNILEKAIQELAPSLGFSDRVVAEDILVNNVSNVFDFSESQAPIWNFAQEHCSVKDRFLIHSKDEPCEGFMNPAVEDVLDFSGLSVMDLDTGMALLEPGFTYSAQIREGRGVRTVLFSTAYIPSDSQNDELDFDLQSCSGFFGCDTISLPFSSSLSVSQSIIPRPEWFDLREFTLNVNSGDFIVSNLEAIVISGPSGEARISGLEAGTFSTGDSVSFSLQTRRSTSTSEIEFSFDVEGIAGEPATFFVSATAQTN